MKFLVILLLSIIQYACAVDVNEAIKISALQIERLSNEYVNVASFLQYVPKIQKFMADVERYPKWNRPVKKGEIFIQSKFHLSLRQFREYLKKVEKEYLNFLIYPILTNEKFGAIKDQKTKCSKSDVYQENAVKAVESITKCAENSIKNLPNIWEINGSQVRFGKKFEVYTRLLSDCVKVKDEKCIVLHTPALQCQLDSFSKDLMKLPKTIPSGQFLEEENKFLICSHKVVRPFYINHCG